MEFEPTETQRLLAETAGRLVRDRHAFEQRKAILATPTGYSAELWAEFAALGLLGVEIGEAHGGSGGGFKDLAVILEAFGRGLVVEPFLPTVVLGAGLLRAAGGSARQAALLPGVAAGTIRLALAHGEPESRHSTNRVATTARREGDGWLLSGRKAVVLGGDCADWLIVSARTAGGIADRDGISLFLVERGAAGLDIRAHRNLDDRGAAEIGLERVRLPAEALLGEAGAALPLIEQAIDRGAVALCCDAVGAMAGLNDLTLDYLKTRTQFGRPIGKFQALQHRMVDMKIAEESARVVADLAADQIDGADAAARARLASAAKAQIGTSAQIVGRGAIQLHGGIALTMEYAAGHYFRRLTAVELTFGDTAHHLARFMAG